MCYPKFYQLITTNFNIILRNVPKHQRSHSDHTKIEHLGNQSERDRNTINDTVTAFMHFMNLLQSAKPPESHNNRS